MALLRISDWFGLSSCTRRAPNDLGGFETSTSDLENRLGPPIKSNSSFHEQCVLVGDLTSSKLVSDHLAALPPRHRSSNQLSRERSRSRDHARSMIRAELQLWLESRSLPCIADGDVREDGYRGNIEDLAAAHGFPVRSSSHVYLDFAGAALVSAHHSSHAEALLRKVPLGNPHTSHAVRVLHTQVRLQVLRYFNASPDDYSVIFTANATSAIRIVDDHFPYGKGSILAHDLDCHTSVLGLRQRARRLGAHVGWYDTDHLSRLATSIDGLQFLDSNVLPTEGSSPNLLVVTGESNFSGNVVDLGLMDLLRGGTSKWLVLLDAAKLAASQRIDLSRTPVDFMAVSFYKMFGRPTGLGALVVRKDSGGLLLADESSYFGGGTVAAATGMSDFVALVKSDLSERFEFGTPNTLGIAELPAAFMASERLHGTPAQAGRHARAVAGIAASKMKELRHKSASDRCVCELYGKWDLAEPPANQGATIAFNILDKEGDYFSFSYVRRCALSRGIMLRCGSMCNHGACQKYLGLGCETVVSNFKDGHTCKFPADVVNGRPTGALRASFGPISSLSDVDRLVDFLATFIDKSAFWEILRTEYPCNTTDQSARSP